MKFNDFITLYKYHNSWANCYDDILPNLIFHSKKENTKMYIHIEPSVNSSVNSSVKKKPSLNNVRLGIRTARFP